MAETSYSSYYAKLLFDRCNDLMAIRPRYSSKEEFAMVVLNNLFEDPTLDLLLLKPRADTLHADALNRLNALVGFESTVFMTIYTNDALFNEFIAIFCAHVQRSTASEHEAAESIYMWLLVQYLQYLLPVDEQKLNLLKNSNWLSGPLSSLPTSAVTSPRRLLRPEVLAASSPLEHISLRSGSFRTLYPRLLQFVGNMLNQLASLSNWPSVAQFKALQTVLNHYNEFILSETEDAEFSSLKLLLLRKPLFTDLLRNFLDRLLKNWPLGDSYCLLMEIWLDLVYPPMLYSRCSDEKRNLFLDSSTHAFVELIEVQIRRLLDSSCEQLLETPVLNLLKEIFLRQEQLLAVFDRRGLSIVDYFRAILGKLCACRNEIHARMNKIRPAHVSSSLWWAWLLNWLFTLTYKPPVNLQLLDQQIYELHQLITWLIQRAGATPQDYFSESSFMSEIQQKGGQSPSMANSILRPEVPDHETDQWTKMLFLTPHGRMQVLNRQARFDYSPYGKQISDTFPAIGFWDIGPLARFLHHLSIRWTNSWLVRYLRQHGRDSVITRMAARALLSGPSPPRYVPVFARLVPKHEARLNLRQFASLPVLLYTLFFAFALFTFLYTLF